MYTISKWTAYMLVAVLISVSVSYAAPNPNSQFGAVTHTLRQDLNDESELAASASDCGIGWVRISVIWEWIETSQDSYTWTYLDEVVDAAVANDLCIYATIVNTPDWATTGTTSCGVPDDPDDWYDFVYDLVTRYKDDIQHWGMWNEPNLDQFWEGTQSEYINDILKNGADAVHAADANAYACGPETSHSQEGVEWLEDCLTAASSKVDIATQHMYDADGYGDVTDRLNDPAQSPSVKEALTSASWTGPFWLTEVGFAYGQNSNFDDQGQAEELEGLLNDWFTGQSGQGWVDKLFIYEFFRYSAYPDITWGILGSDPTYTELPAYEMYEAFIADSDDVLLWEGFEDSFDQWTDGGSTNWDRTTSQKLSGRRSAHCGWLDDSLVSDDMDTRGYSNITISFYYRDDDIDDNDDVNFQLYNGTNYASKFELGNTSPEDTWHKYTCTLNNSGAETVYFRSNFRIKFKGIAIDWGENLWIDHVKVTAN